MAKRKINKSEKIRAYLAEHPDAGPTEVSRALRPLKVSAGLVSSIKNSEKRKSGQPGGRRKKRGGMAGGRRSVAAGNGLMRRGGRNMEPIVVAAELIRLCGGVTEAQAALKTAGQVASVLE